MLFRTPTLSASVFAVLAFYAVATPTGPPLNSAEDPMLRDYNAQSHPSPPAPPYVPKPYSHSDNKVKVEGMSFGPSSHEPYPEKPKPEEKPYVSPPPFPPSLLPLTPSKEEKPKPYEKDRPSAPPPKSYPEKPHSPAPPPKSYPEKPKAGGKPYLPLPPALQNLKPEKKPEGKPYAVPVPKDNKPKPDDKSKPDEKPHAPPSPQGPYSQKDEADKQRDRNSNKDDAKNGCVAGKCKRLDAVSCLGSLFR